jgi:hypothetical protein
MSLSWRFVYSVGSQHVIGTKPMIRLLDEGQFNHGEALGCIAHLLQEEGPKADVGTFIYGILEDGRWNGQDIDMIEQIANEGNFEASLMAHGLLDHYDDLILKAIASDRPMSL